MAIQTLPINALSPVAFQTPEFSIQPVSSLQKDVFIKSAPALQHNNFKKISPFYVDQTQSLRKLKQTREEKSFLVNSEPLITGSKTFLNNLQYQPSENSDLGKAEKFSVSTQNNFEYLSDIYSSVPFILDSFNDASETVTTEASKTLRQIFTQHPVHQVIDSLSKGVMIGFNLAFGKGLDALTGSSALTGAAFTRSYISSMAAPLFTTLEQNIGAAADALTAKFAGLKPTDIPVFMDEVNLQFKQALRDTLFSLRDIESPAQLKIMRDCFDAMTRNLKDLTQNFMQGMIQSILELGQKAVVHTPFGIYADTQFTPLITVTDIQNNGQPHRIAGIKIPEVVSQSPILKQAYLETPGALTQTINIGIFRDDLSIIVQNGKVISWNNQHLTLDDSPVKVMKQKGARSVTEALQMIVDVVINQIGNVEKPISELDLAELM